jgi:hypothetical protein
MAEKIYDKIKNRIASYEAGEVFLRQTLRIWHRYLPFVNVWGVR